MPERLNQEKIRRMVGSGGAVGGGGGSFDPSALAGYASQAWVEDNYISKLFFGRMFTANGTQKVYTSTDGGTTWGDPVTTAVTIAPNEITPSEEIVDGDTSGTKIKTVRELSSIQALVGLWTQQYLSALGQNSSGGGGGGGSSTLAGLLDVSIPNPMTQANDGQVLMYNYTQNKWINGNLPATGVTSVGMTVPTGFSVSPATITSSDTFAITFASGYSLPTTAKQANWDAAYTDRHTHSNKSVLDGITSTDVSHWDTAYGWGDHAQAGYSTPSSVASQMQTYAKIQSGTITIGDNSITPLTQHQTVSGTFWGQSWSNGGTVSGDMTGVGTIKMTGHLYMHEGGTGIYLNSDGTGIDWHDTSDSYVASLLAFTSSMVTAHQGLTIPVNKSLRIGDGVLTWDTTNNAFKVEKYDGTAANFYATGGVSALGVSTGGSVTNLDVTGKITFADNYKIEVSAGDMYIGDSTNEQYVKVSDMCSWNGSTYWYITASGNARFQRIYLDASRYIYVSNGTFYFYNGSTSKEIAFV